MDKTDLFALALGIEIAGAYLLAHGLLASSATLIRRTTSYWNFSPVEAVSQAGDKVDATSGLGALAGGFVIQLAAYVANAINGNGIEATRGSVSHGLLRIGLAIGGGVTILALWRRLRGQAIKRVVVELASVNTDGSREEPWGRRLMLMGQELGLAPRIVEGFPEGEADYALRVFGIETIRSGDPGDIDLSVARLG